MVHRVRRRRFNCGLRSFCLVKLRSVINVFADFHAVSSRAALFLSLRILIALKWLGKLGGGGGRRAIAHIYQLYIFK